MYFRGIIWAIVIHNVLPTRLLSEIFCSIISCVSASHVAKAWRVASKRALLALSGIAN